MARSDISRGHSACIATAEEKQTPGGAVQSEPMTRFALRFR